MSSQTVASRPIWAALLAVVASFAAVPACVAQDRLKIAVGGRGIGETFVTEVGYTAGLFKKHNLAAQFSIPTAAVRPSRP